MARRREHRSGRVDAIALGDKGHVSVGRARDPLSGGNRHWGHHGRQHLGVLAVAQKRVRDPGSSQHLLGCQMVADDKRRAAGVNSNTRGVDDVAYTGRNRRRYRGLVLTLAAFSDVQRADEQHLAGTRKRSQQRLLVVEVSAAHLRTPRLEALESRGRACHQDQLRCRHLLQQGLSDHPAKCA